jgi:hypothetical protein
LPGRFSKESAMARLLDSSWSYETDRSGMSYRNCNRLGREKVGGKRQIAGRDFASRVGISHPTRRANASLLPLYLDYRD